MTEVPVIGIVTMCIIARASPIIIPARSPAHFFAVAPKIIIRKSAVKTTSATRAEARENHPRYADPYPFAPRAEKLPAIVPKIAAPITAPII